MKTATKTCSLDPIPTDLLKECIDAPIKSITLIINKSLSIGVFPNSWKEAFIKNYNLRSNI